MDPLVEEIELLEGTPLYAHVRYPDGRESSVSLRHLAPVGSPEVEEMEALSVAPGEDSAHEPGKEPIGSGSPSSKFTTSSQPTERIDPLNHEAVRMSVGEPPPRWHFNVAQVHAYASTARAARISDCSLQGRGECPMGPGMLGAPQAYCSMTPCKKMQVFSTASCDVTSALFAFTKPICCSLSMH
uniref:Uncharacterized protein n=1 Tax=Trichuris muris TaxID=70415 RepID=A0A5S6R0F8_TRIMR